jgi:hypothetical protein
MLFFFLLITSAIYSYKKYVFKQLAKTHRHFRTFWIFNLVITTSLTLEDKNVEILKYLYINIKFIMLNLNFYSELVTS